MRMLTQLITVLNGKQSFLQQIIVAMSNFNEDNTSQSS